nr:MAG TPA: hypothetical protein [Caudoviricetes sp.]
MITFCSIFIIIVIISITVTIYNRIFYYIIIKIWLVEQTRCKR